MRAKCHSTRDPSEETQTMHSGWDRIHPGVFQTDGLTLTFFNCSYVVNWTALRTNKVSICVLLTRIDGVSVNATDKKEYAYL